MPEFTLYQAPASARCRAVLLHHRLLGQTAPELELVEVDDSPEAPRLPDLLRNNPLYTLPTLVTPWGPLWESRTIMRFIESLCPEPVGYPLATFHRASVDRLLDWDLGTLSPRLVRAFDTEGDLVPEMVADFHDAMMFLERKQLGDGRAFLTGNAWTIADLSCHMTLSLLRLLGVQLGDVPRVDEWNARMRALPGWDEIDAPFQALLEPSDDAVSADGTPHEPESQPADIAATNEREELQPRDNVELEESDSEETVDP